MTRQQSDALLADILRRHAESVSPAQLVEELTKSGHSPKEARLAIQRALDKQAVTLDKKFHIRAKGVAEAA